MKGNNYKILNILRTKIDFLDELKSIVDSFGRATKQWKNEKNQTQALTSNDWFLYKIKHWEEMG